MLHGVERYLVAGEGVVEGALLAGALRTARAAPQQFGQAAAADAQMMQRAADPFITPEKRLLAPVHQYCRLFDKGMQPEAEALITLGLAMETEQDVITEPNSSIAAGYTYLGQFIDHDITFDTKALDRLGETDVGELVNARTPALDLDSLYGGGPEKSPKLYEADGAHMRVGLCTPSLDADGNEIPALPNDLPREDRTALIADRRNDENLAIAQLHLAFIKFHNTFVDELQAAHPTLSAAELFARAREQTILHYQRIILRDFLPRIVDSNAIEQVLRNGHAIYPEHNHDLMPLEFSAAAYRFGHSMVRPVYDWNRVFHQHEGAVAPATLDLLFEFTQFSGSHAPGDLPFFNAETLPSNWVVDWRMMFDVEGNPPPELFIVNRARKIDTNLALHLKRLPEFLAQGETDEALLSLSCRNLLRGRLLSLPHGLQVAEAIVETGLPHETLTLDQLRGGPHGQTLEQAGLLETPPLWYYILREAEVNGGEPLGPVGSRIVAETIVALIRKCDVSILSGRNSLGLGDIPYYSMSDMLRRVNDLAPV